MTDPTALIGYVLDSPWLLPLLTLAVICDGPVPFLPSEPVLFSATASALAEGDRLRILALFLAALAGSLIGDGVLYGLGRSSAALVRPGRRDAGLGAWVHRHLHRRPIVALVATRLVPGGRLASVTAAGRFRLPARAFLPATLASSLVWCTWMTGIGALVGPFTKGDPLLSVLAGLALGATVALTAGLARRAWRVRHRFAAGVG